VTGPTAYERLLDRLEGVKRTGDTAAAHCPAHDDRRSSLSIGVADQFPGAVVKCHVGCTVEAIMAKVGGTVNDLFDEHRQAKQGYAVVAEYPYHDEFGQVLYVKERRWPKDFRQYVPLPDGRKRYKLDGVRRVLYRLPEVVAAIKAGQTVYVSEGEADADRLVREDVAATCNVEGASKSDQKPKWRPEYTEQLLGAHLVVIADRDDAGRAHARNIVKQLTGVAASVKLVQPAVDEDKADVSDHLNAGYSLDQLVPLELDVWTDDGDSANDDGQQQNKSDGDKKSAATLLVELALDQYQFGCTEDGKPFAIRPGQNVVRMLRGGKNSLRAELSQAYYWRYRKAPPQQALADALLVLDGEATSRAPSKVHLRVAAANGAIWIDLGDAAETVVKIDATGWQLASTDIPVLFERTTLTGVMPEPQHGGNLDMLWQHLNVAEADRPLVLAVLIAAIATPNAPHVVLALLGEQGTGKTTACKRIVEMVDPSPVPLRKPPKDAESWVTAAQGSWVVALDNLSQVPDWLSDSICRAATGEGDVRRALYTDGGLAVFAFRRCVLLNGIDVGALRGDLADRTVRVTLDLITDEQRKKDAELDERWRQTYPQVLGALFAGVAGVAGVLSSVRLESKPRMADFAHVLAAVDQLYDTNGLARFMDQARVMAEDLLSADPFLVAMAAAKLDFKGTAAQLLEDLTPAEERRLPRDWPKNARAVTGLLKRNAPALRKAGWTVQDDPDPHSKVTEWTLISPERGRKPHPQHPQDPQTGAETCQVLTWRVCKNQNCQRFEGCVLADTDESEEKRS
jgi:hypothetical protein